MKALVVAAAFAFLGTAYAQAETTVIEHDAPPAAGVVIEKHDAPVIEHRSVEHDCSTKTVRKESDDGDSKTVTKKDCD